MQPPGEQPNQPSDGRPPLSRERSTDGTPPIQRQPVFTRRANFDPAPDARPVPPEPEAVPEMTPEPPAPVEQPAPPPQAEPVTPEPTPRPSVASAVLPPEQTAPAPAAQQQSTPLSFTPPLKKKRGRWLPALLLVVAVGVISAGLFGFLKAQAAKNNPETIFKDAMQNNLSVTKLQSQTKTDTVDSQTKYDFTNPKDPIVSTEATIKQANKSVVVKGYGSAKNTYISYTGLPKTLNSQLAAVSKDGWIQLRANGVDAKDVDAALTDISDPDYLAFGPLLTGNFADKTREQLINFLLQHKVYGYDSGQVKHETLSGKKVIAYPIKLNVSYLKIANQSAAASEGIEPTKIQTATDALEQLKGATVTLYVNADDHTFALLKISKNGETKTISYSNYNNLSLPDEPQTKLMYQNFAPVQAQISNQVNLTKPLY